MNDTGLLALFASAFATGFVVAIPPGAVTVRAAQLALGYGFRQCMLFTVGSSMSDIFYLVMAYLGAAHLLAGDETLTAVFFLASGLLLMYFGVGSLRKPPAHLGEGAKDVAPLPAARLVASGIGITLLNPLTIGGWLAIGGNYFVRVRAEWPDAPAYGAFAILAIMCGVLAWFVPLMYAVYRLKARVNEKAVRALVKLSSLFLIGFGVAAWWSAAAIIAGR